MQPPVRIAIVDSGVHADHPHVRGIAGGVGIAPDGALRDDFLDRLGHGTAVSAVIREKAPNAEMYAVKIFDRDLSATAEALVAAIAWGIARGCAFVNLSLGTTNPAHRNRLAHIVRAAVAARVVIVAAAPEPGTTRPPSVTDASGPTCEPPVTHQPAGNLTREVPPVVWLPGALDGVVSVLADWTMARDEMTIVEEAPGRLVVRASAYPRPIRGVPPDRNLRGASFAVANATGLLARGFDQNRALLDKTVLRTSCC